MTRSNEAGLKALTASIRVCVISHKKGFAEMLIHYSELTPEQRATVDRWDAAGRPSPSLLVLRRTKDRVRLLRKHRFTEKGIRDDIAETFAEIVGDDRKARDYLLPLVEQAIAEVLAEPADMPDPITSDAIKAIAAKETEL
ncbi:hypothetical protein [Singulisphaera sp. PoT]|uniref:hypothetical protein n=1 Tax=Singulisphaera sp. PoT TaxID=3411797 RepID=UPI003BF49B6A